MWLAADCSLNLWIDAEGEPLGGCEQLSQPSPKSNPNSNLGLAGQHN